MRTASDATVVSDAATNRIVGVIVNPVAGKDIRRLVSGASHTSDSAKIGIVSRVVAAAAEAGASRILLADDPHRLARRAIERLSMPQGSSAELLSEPVTGQREDTVNAAATLRKLDAAVIVVLGGDGTCRDVATGWPDAPIVAISTGTNNVYPSTIDGTSAGTAAGLIASGAVPLGTVSAVSKRIIVHLDGPDVSGRVDDVALVDVALVATPFVGARAVRNPSEIRSVIAAIGDPASTGLSSIAGRLQPVPRDQAGGLFVRLAAPTTTEADAFEIDGAGDGRDVRTIRVPLSPGSFDSVTVAEVRTLRDGETVTMRGPGVLAFDGERDLPVSADTIVTLHVERSGPRIIDVPATLHRAVLGRLFDADVSLDRSRTRPVDAPGATRHGTESP